uniref:Uncharacterized protein n=1 Tax=Arundo donax TaxID=35708 RepID=A0A0A9H9T3_ARUDO
MNPELFLRVGIKPPKVNSRNKYARRGRPSSRQSRRTARAGPHWGSRHHLICDSFIFLNGLVV